MIYGYNVVFIISVSEMSHAIVLMTSVKMMWHDILRNSESLMWLAIVLKISVSLM